MKSSLEITNRVRAHNQPSRSNKSTRIISLALTQQCQVHTAKVFRRRRGAYFRISIYLRTRAAARPRMFARIHAPRWLLSEVATNLPCGQLPPLILLPKRLTADRQLVVEDNMVHLRYVRWQYTFELLSTHTFPLRTFDPVMKSCDQNATR